MMILSSNLYAQKKPLTQIATITKPDSTAVWTYGLTQYCGFVKLSDGRVYGINYADGTNTFSYAFCLDNYTKWFTMRERTKTPSIASIPVSSFGGLVQDRLMIGSKLWQRKLR